MVGACGTCGEGEEQAHIFVRGTEVKRPLKRSVHRGEDNIKMDIKEMGPEDVEWINMTQEKDKWRAFVNTVLKFWV
jgi:hypothetical protein